MCYLADALLPRPVLGFRSNTYGTSGESSASCISEQELEDPLKDHTRIETVVEVAGVGRLVLDVDSAGGYSLRAYPEGSEAPSRNLLAVGVMRAEGIVAIHPEELSAVEGEQGASRSERSSDV